MNKYKGILFDLDGTLVDSVESIAMAGNKALHGVGLKEHPVDNYKYYAGDGVDMLIKRALKDAGDISGEHFDKAYAIYKECFKEDCTYKVQAFDGIKEMLDQLKKQGIKIGVISNKPHLRTVDVVESIFGKGYFDIIAGQKEEVPKKPNPTSTLAAAKELGIRREECVYVGDTDVDMQTGNRAGMFTIGVLWGFRDEGELEKNNAQMIIKKPEELFHIF